MPLDFERLMTTEFATIIFEKGQSFFNDDFIHVNANQNLRSIKMYMGLCITLFSFNLSNIPNLRNRSVFLFQN